LKLKGAPFSGETMPEFAAEYWDIKLNRPAEFRALVKAGRLATFKWKYSQRRIREKPSGARLAVLTGAERQLMRVTPQLAGELRAHDSDVAVTAARKRKAAIDSCANFERWTSRQPLPKALEACGDRLPEGGSLAQGPSSSHIKVVSYTPPLADFSKDLASRLTEAEREILYKSFVAHHRTLHVATLKPLPDVAKKYKGNPCCYSGMCLLHCSRGRRVAVVERKLAAVLKQLFPKDSRPRHLLQQSGLLVFCFESSRGDRIFYHASYLKYTTWLGAYLRLEVSGDPSRPPLSFAKRSLN
jgi:hypothetical protein